MPCTSQTVALSMLRWGWVPTNVDNAGEAWGLMYCCWRATGTGRWTSFQLRPPSSVPYRQREPVLAF